MNLFDKVISAVSPRWAFEREQAKSVLAAYRGGVSTRVSTPWGASRSMSTGTGADRRNLGSMRDRARRVWQENAIGRSILKTEVDNVVADGFTLQARTSSKEFNAEVEARWKAWMDQADITGKRSGAELQREAYRMARCDGDGGVVLVDRGGRSFLQLIPGDLIQNPDSWKPEFRDGVEVDRVGRPIAFHVLDQDELGTRSFERIASSNFLFLAHYPETMQVRGESCYATVFPLLDQLDAYVDAVVIAARMGAIFGLLFKSDTAQKQYNSLPTLTNSQGAAQKAITLENGQARYLGSNDEVVQVNATQPMSQTPDFVRCVLRLIGLPFDMPLELVLRDVSQANLSSQRGALHDFRRACRIRRKWYADHWGRVYRWWLDRAVEDEVFHTIVPPDLHRHELHAKGWEFTDPVTEVQAKILECEAGFDAPQNVMSEMGRDPDTIARQNAEWKALRAAAGMAETHSTYTRDPMAGQPAPTPGAPPMPAQGLPALAAKSGTKISGDCGTGDGGFKSGNDCAGEGGGGSSSVGKTIEKWANKAAELPGKIYNAAKNYAAKKYGKLEKRYGRKMAIAIMVAGIAGTAVPLPGTSLLAAAPLIGAAEIYRAMTSGAKGAADDESPELSPEEIEELGKAFAAEMLDEWDAETLEDADLHAFWDGEITANCGTGDGGFKEGNDCAGEEGGGGKTPNRPTRKGDSVKWKDRDGVEHEGVISSPTHQGNVIVTEKDGKRSSVKKDSLAHSDGKPTTPAAPSVPKPAPAAPPAAPAPALKPAAPQPAAPSSPASAAVTQGVSKALASGTARDFKSLQQSAGNVPRGDFEDYVRDLEKSGAVRLTRFEGSDYQMDNDAHYVVRNGEVMEAATATGKPLPPFQPKPKADPAWKSAATAAVVQHGADNPLLDMPIPTLFKSLKSANPNLTAGQFHEGLRELATQQKVSLQPWTGSIPRLAAVDPDSLSLVVGKEQKFYLTPGRQ